MSAKIDDVGKIKSLCTLSDLFAEITTVQKTSNGGSCCCVFHDDKNPSMSIDDARGFYHCFGCGASGDAISFVQNYYQLGFREALKWLADRYGVELSNARKAPAAQNNALLLLQEIFSAELPKNAAALRYLHERGLSDELIAHWGIGYAPSNEATLKALERAKISAAQALEQGAIKQKDGAVYASFIERISIPISDANGALIGFGARTLNAANPAKYVNSPACKLFDKKRVLFGLFAAKTAMRRAKMLLICEGYMDAIAFSAAGVHHVAAVLGVALSEQHLAQIPRDVFVRLCFDSDSAGRAAAFKAATLLARAGYNGDVIALSGAKDAGDFLAAGKLTELAEQAGRSGENIIAFACDYIFKQILNIADLSAASECDPFEKRRAFSEVAGFLRTLDGFLAEQHLQLFCQRAQINLAAISAANQPAERRAPSNSREQTTAAKAASMQVQPSAAEISALVFCLRHRLDAAELIIPEHFALANIAQLVRARDYDSFAAMEFLQRHADKELSAVGFLHNLARVYERALSGVHSRLFAQFAAAAAACEKRLCGKQLASAWMLLAQICAWQSGEDFAHLVAQINALGA